MWFIEAVKHYPAEDWICLTYLIGISAYDIYCRRISRRSLIGGGLLAALYVICVSHTWFLSVGGLAAGGLLLFISRATGEKIGRGDAYFIGILGVYAGLWRLLEILMAGWFILALAACVCLVKKKWSRSTALPMTPFVTVGFIISMLAGG